MLIQLNQSDIEIAIRQYINKMGMTRPVDEITFTQSRKGGTSIQADIELIDPEVTEVRSKPVVVSENDEVVAPEPEAVTEEEPEAIEEEAPAKESKSLFGG